MRRFSNTGKPFVELAKEEIDTQRRYNYQNQRQIGLANMPYAAPKQSRDIAAARPWTGEESPIDTSLRMLLDSNKRLKIKRSDRLVNAREAVLDYAYNEAEGPTYKERLKKPRQSSSGLSSGGWVESIAAHQIEDAIARGQFKDIPRGEGKRSLNMQGIANPDLDLTQYLLNNIIKKEGGTPPWIAKQLHVKKKISVFRTQIQERLRERLVLRYIEQFDGLRDPKKIVANSLKQNHQDLDWERHYSSYHQAAVDDINNAIRGYNLQAPPTARWGYISVNDEVNNCYANIEHGLGDSILKHLGRTKVIKHHRKSLHESMPPIESPENHYGLIQLVKDLWHRRVP